MTTTERSLPYANDNYNPLPPESVRTSYANGTGALDPAQTSVAIPLPAQDTLEEKPPLFLWANDLKNLPPVEYFDLPPTHHGLPKRKITLLYGLSGSCKSFLALDIALKIGQSLPVLYVAGEGIDGYNDRIQAWRAANGGHLQNVAFWNTADHNAPQFCEPEQLADILSVARQVGEARGQPVALIVIDTLARVIVGMEENSNAEMGMMIDACELLIRETGAAVILVHHTDKAGRVPRGAGAVLGAVQSSLSVVRNMRENLIAVTCDKSKDSGDDNPITGTTARHFSLMPSAESVVLAPLTKLIVEKDQVTAKERDMLEALADANKPLTRHEWWGCCSEEVWSKDWAKDRGNFSAYVRRLKNKGFIDETDVEPREATITDAGRVIVGAKEVETW